MSASKWLTWTPKGINADNAGASQCQGERVDASFEGFDGSGTDLPPIISADVAGRTVSSAKAPSEIEAIRTPPTVEPSKPSLTAMTIDQVRKHRLFIPEDSPKRAPADDNLSARHSKGAQHNQMGNVCAPPDCPPLPRGLKLIRYVPRIPPVKLDDGYTSISNVSKFIDSELQELYARLYSPAQIRGGHGVFVILDRLRQVGLEIEMVAANRDIALTAS
jgi:hypothetical protein